MSDPRNTPAKTFVLNVEDFAAIPTGGAMESDIRPAHVDVMKDMIQNLTAVKGKGYVTILLCTINSLNVQNYIMQQAGIRDDEMIADVAHKMHDAFMHNVIMLLAAMNPEKSTQEVIQMYEGAEKDFMRLTDVTMNTMCQPRG